MAALVRSAPRAEPLRKLGCRLVAGSLADKAALEALVDGADVVFHVAGVVAARSEAEFLRTNRDGAVAVARASARAGASRFVLVSSIAVTGPSRRGRSVDEVSGSGPITAYGRSKQAGEEAVRATGVPLTIVRPPVVYGPRDRALLTLFRAAARGFVPLLGDGSQELSLVHAADLAQALVAAGRHATTLGRTYHAGHPEPVTQRGLAMAVGRAVGRPVGRPVRCPTLPGTLVRGVLGALGVAARSVGRATLLDWDKANEVLAPAWVCSSDALQRDAAWSARISLESGLAETARSYRESGWL